MMGGARASRSSGIPPDATRQRKGETSDSPPDAPAFSADVGELVDGVVADVADLLAREVECIGPVDRAADGLGDEGVRERPRRDG
jgi:hypothetical protein